MRWITVGPADQPGTSIVLHPPAADPGITDDERRTITEMMAKGTYAGIILATTDLDGTFERLQASDAEVVQEPTDQPYGVRDCAFRDPAGNMIRIRGALSLPTPGATDEHRPPQPESRHAARRRQPRPDPRARRAGEQPQGRQRRDPEAPADGVHRRLRLGQELAGVRHDRRRVAAADQRDLQRVRAGLHADAGAARRRRARRADHRDHRRPGADGRRPALHGRHRHRRQRDAAHPVQPARASRTSARRRRSPSTSPRSAARAPSRSSKAGQKVEGASQLQPSPAACARAARAAARSTTSTSPQLYDDSKSLNEGALTIPGYSMDGWYGRIFRGSRLLRPGQADPEVHEEGAPRPALQGADQDQGRGHQPHLRGADPARSRSRCCPRTSTRCSRTSARSSSARSRSPPAPSATAPGSAEAARSSKIKGISIADACAMQISDLAEWVRGLDEPSVAPLLAALRHTLDSFVEIGLGYLSASTGRRARCRAARRSAPR